ncbi:SDR family NAD(P)-dependent oxidoreductase [Microterricola viridarii]|uniref:Dehydrogenase n=1 Tax=Microterricola viridarii TaxID=412690 RepID=A0A0X8E5C5_9MICO|nr:SDR family oxidoreductase [Microterricola viridarii]AMB59346.1 dehydrogenase [Microterricola viridarii]
MDLALGGRTVVISGAASGIGLATAHAFAEEGALVAMLDRDAPALAAAHAGLAANGARVAAFVCDVTDERAVADAVSAAARELGGIDHLVSCAGISGPFGAALEQISLAQWNAVFSVNVSGAFLLVRAALPWLRAADAASIVFLASDSAVVAAPGMVPYCSSKAALVQLAKALAVEFSAAGEGIRVNAVCPSIVDTPLSRADLGLHEHGFTGADYPVQSADEVAQHVLYLSSVRSRPVNGAALLSDFGYTARSSFPA